MSIFRRRLLGQQEGALYEKEVEYLTFHGTEYFEIPVTPNEATDAIEINFRITGTVSAQTRLCCANGGCHIYANAGSRMAWSLNAGDTTGWMNFTANNYSGIGNVDHRMKVDYYNHYADYDCFVKTMSSSTRVCTSNLYIAKSTNDSHPPFNGRIYSIRYWRNGTLLHDIVAVRKRGVGCLYDKISEELYENQGTGNCGLGQDKFSDINYYNVVDYISTSGTASGYSQPYIDTGIGSADGVIQMTMVAKWHTLATARTQYFGTITSASTANNHPWFGCSGNTYISNGGVTYPDINPPSTTAYTTFTMSAYTPTLTGQNVGPITLFRTYYVTDRRQTSNAYAHVASCKLKSFQITVGGELVRNFVPVRHPISNRYGMFDLVEKKFYDSANGTAFLGGFDT